MYIYIYVINYILYIVYITYDFIDINIASFSLPKTLDSDLTQIPPVYKLPDRQRGVPNHPAVPELLGFMVDTYGLMEV